MQTWKKLLLQVTLSGLCALTLPGIVSPAAAQQTGTSSSRELQTSEKSADQPSSSPHSENDLPDSPGATLAKMQEPAQQPSPATPANSPPAANAADSTQQAPEKPVGTATAEAPDTSGIAASQPAGAAIAPAKQHRVRTIVIKVGAIIGVGAAVGTVVALSEATSSRPPGAH